VNSVAIRSEFVGDDPLEGAAAPFVRHQRFLRARKSLKTLVKCILGLMRRAPSLLATLAPHSA
jgi:hypothetical protein